MLLTEKIGLGFICFSGFLLNPCFGGNFTVTTNADSGSGSLRQAIVDVNAGTDTSNTITINPSIGTITLGSNLPLITNPVTITGNNAVVDGQNLHRSFAFQSSLSGVNGINAVTIQNCRGIGGNGGNGINNTCTDGSGAGGGAGGFGGGVIFLDANPTSLSNVLFSNNQAIGGDGGINTVPGPSCDFGGSGGGMEESGETGGPNGGNGLNGMGGGTSSSRNGGFGGGAAGGENAAGIVNGANGGFGGGGGGGVFSTSGHGNGRGGPGGFGGGGGSSTANASGSGGFGGGDGRSGNDTTFGGGGGAGMGGALFLYQGTTVTIANPFFSGNAATGGGGVGNPGMAFGQDVFMMSGSNLTFDLSTDLSMPSAIQSDQGAGGGSGGGLIKSGSATLTLAGSNTYTGITTVNAGTLNLNGSIITNTNINGGRLQGTGSLLGGANLIVNGGTVAPGSSIGTITVTGDYTQGPSGTLEIEIDNSGNSDLLQVTGTATLDGVLNVIAAPGIYMGGQTFTILTAGGGVVGTFSSIIDNSLALVVEPSYFMNEVQLSVVGNGLSPPTFNLSGNASDISNYLICSSFPFDNADLLAVIEALFNLSPDQYASALTTLAPTQYGALPLSELESNFSIANTFFVLGTGQRSHCYISKTKPTSIWMNPFGFIYTQKGRQQAQGFDANTYGGVVGIDHLLARHWIVGAGVGYSHSHLDWKQNRGKSNANSIYLGPYVKYDSKYVYFDFLLLGAGNFYKIDRKIQFPGISRKANSCPNTWNLSEIFLVGGRVPFFRNTNNLFFQPEVLLVQMNIFQGNFKEKGADSINLSVKSKYASFLRSLINAKFVKEWHLSNNKFCLTPSINIGWFRTTPLANGNYTAKFRDVVLCESDFTVNSFHETIDQLLVGAQFLFSHQGNFDFSLEYEGEFGEGAKVNTVNVALRWRF